MYNGLQIDSDGSGPSEPWLQVSLDMQKEGSPPCCCGHVLADRPAPAEFLARHIPTPGLIVLCSSARRACRESVHFSLFCPQNYARRLHLCCHFRAQTSTALSYRTTLYKRYSSVTSCQCTQAKWDAACRHRRHRLDSASCNYKMLGYSMHICQGYRIN